MTVGRVHSALFPKQTHHGCRCCCHASQLDGFNATDKGALHLRPQSDGNVRRSWLKVQRGRDGGRCKTHVAAADKGIKVCCHLDAVDDNVKDTAPGLNLKDLGEVQRDLVVACRAGIENVLQHLGRVCAVTVYGIQLREAGRHAGDGLVVIEVAPGSKRVEERLVVLPQKAGCAVDEGLASAIETELLAHELCGGG